MDKHRYKQVIETRVLSKKRMKSKLHASPSRRKRAITPTWIELGKIGRLGSRSPYIKRNVSIISDLYSRSISIYFSAFPSHSRAYVRNLEKNGFDTHLI